MALRIVVHPDLCCGLRLCMKAAPKVYKPDREGFNGSNGAIVPPDQIEAAREGAEICPECAIELVEEPAGEATPAAFR